MVEAGEQTQRGDELHLPQEAVEGRVAVPQSRVRLGLHVSVQTGPESNKAVTEPDPNPTGILFFNPTQLL